MYLRIYTYMYRINSLTYLVSCLLDRVTSWLLLRTSSPDFGICGIFQPCGLAEVFATSCLGYFREWSSKTCSLKSCRCGGGTGELICSCGYMRTYTHMHSYIHTCVYRHVHVHTGGVGQGGGHGGWKHEQPGEVGSAHFVCHEHDYLSIYLSIYLSKHAYIQTDRQMHIYIYVHTYIWSPPKTHTPQKYLKQYVRIRTYIHIKLHLTHMHWAQQPLLSTSIATLSQTIINIRSECFVPNLRARPLKAWSRSSRKLWPRILMPGPQHV